MVAKRELYCYYCQHEVSPDDHVNVQRAIELVLNQDCDNSIHARLTENTFVHMIQVLPGNLDGDLVVVCPKDFVREIAENYEVLAEEAADTKEANS